MNSFEKKVCFVVILLIVFAVFAQARIDAEMEGLEVESRGDGTFLIGSPTYFFDRVAFAGGIHSESELWTPKKLRQRLLFNRMSVLPSWDPIESSVWAKTGNELGDMIYQDLITEKNRPLNRTPILEGGFTTPSFKGFWITARGFQDDHYSTKTSSARKKLVDDEFALFGENYPMFSSFYAGIGFTRENINASVFAGEEYLWLFTKSLRWIPVHYKPRVDARLDISNFSLTATYEDAEFQNKKMSEKGRRKELSGSVFYKCEGICQSSVLQLSAGLSFRALDDSGMVYTQLNEDRVFWPFMELRIQPFKRLTTDVMFGINENDWLVQDSIEYAFPTKRNMDFVIGLKNISGTRLNPLADTKEFFNEDTMLLKANGQMSLIEAYINFADTLGIIAFGSRLGYWKEYGAETFTEKMQMYDLKENMVYRSGNVSRIHSWINGAIGEIWMSLRYENIFAFTALGGIEHIDGVKSRFEVEPSEYFAAFEADWLLIKSFRISHSLRYRSDAKWNLITLNPFVVKGDWYWDATFEQQFPKYDLYLTGTILRALGKEVVQVPNGGIDRIRFICSVKKKF